MTCPKCQGPLLDQRATKTGRQPDYQCANPGCVNEKGFRTGVWLRGAKSPAAPPATTVAQPLTERPAALAKAEDALPWETSPEDERAVILFWACFDDVLAGVSKRKLTELFKPENLCSLVATLYIQRAKLRS